VGFYVYARPVSGPGLFSGREITMRSLTTGLAGNRIFAVCGGPKLGRTSVLQHLYGQNLTSWVRNPKQVKLVPIVLDVQIVNPGPTPLIGSKNFAENMWKAVVRAISDPRVYGNAAPPKFPQPQIAKSKEPWELFKQSCEELWTNITGTPAWARTALFLDNCDVLTTRALDVVLPHVQDLLSSKAQYAPAAAVLTGGRMLREFISEKNSPLKMARPLMLSLLKNSEADALVRAGMPTIEPEALELLKFVTGRHPYLLQRVLAQMEEMGGIFDIDRALQGSWADIDPIFQRIWLEFDLRRNVTYRGAYAAPEHALMQYLIDARREIVLKDAERDLGIKPLKEYAEFLEYIGVADRQIRGDVVHLRAPFDLWNRWYLNRIMH
jgi:hypothetical protein